MLPKREKFVPAPERTFSQSAVIVPEVPEFLPEYQNLEELEDHYRRGGLGDVKVKKFLNNVMQAELSPIRARRKEWEQRIPDVMDILREGSRVAEAKAAETLNDVKASMRINYFDSDQSDMYQK